jgi:ABC-type transporter Mla subunit MlaD
MGLIIWLIVMVAIVAFVVWLADYTSVPRGRSRK